VKLTKRSEAGLKGSNTSAPVWNPDNQSVRPSATMTPLVQMQYEEHFVRAMAAGRAEDDHAQSAYHWGCEAGGCLRQYILAGRLD
jgi:hypothetical protein